MVGAFRLFLICISGGLVLAGCEGEEEVVRREVVRPVKTMVIGEATRSGLRRFPARVESSRRADIAFRVSGKITELSVREGERVSQGQVVAKLDPSDYRTVVNERRARFDRVEKDFGRATQLLKRGFIARQRYDQLEADFKSARAALRQAKLDLSYTTLKAPFSGEISRRFIERFEEVKAKQPIFALRDTTALEVKFDVPEQIMIRLESEDDEGQETPEPDVFVEYNARPDERFPLQFREIATTADPATRTFEATYTMQAPPGLLVLPGMTANVVVDLSAFQTRNSVAYVPVEAVVGADDLSPRVWVIDESTMTASPRPVKVAGMRGGRIAVTEGLKSGDRIAIAGVPFLIEGMKVRAMPDVEQAVERVGDAKIRRAAEKRILQSKPPAK